jgi:hypothetical protein
MFRRPRRTKQWPEKFNEFSRNVLTREDQAEAGKPAVGAALAFSDKRGRQRSLAGPMNRSPGPADSVERRATLRARVRCDPFLNKG